MTQQTTPAVWSMPTGKWRTNCYVLQDGAKNAVVIDPGGSTPAILEHIQSGELTVRAVMNTHGHYDHIGGVAAVIRACSAPYYLHSRDRRVLQHANLYRAMFDGEEMIEIPAVTGWLDQVQGSLKFGGLEVEVIETPGHTPGSVSFLVGEALFTGDTLFRGRVGRIDLPGGDGLALAASLRRLSNLDPGVRVYPGHGSPTSIGDELAGNAALIEALK